MRSVKALCGAMLLTAVMAVPPVVAQSYSLSGKVTDPATHAVPSATVSAKRLTDGKIFTARTNSDGLYAIPDLKAGDYKVWATAGDLEAVPIKVTLAPGESTDLVVSPVPHH